MFPHHSARKPSPSGPGLVTLVSAHSLALGIISTSKMSIRRLTKPPNSRSPARKKDLPSKRKSPAASKIVFMTFKEVLRPSTSMLWFWEDSGSPPGKPCLFGQTEQTEPLNPPHGPGAQKAVRTEGGSLALGHTSVAPWRREPVEKVKERVEEVNKYLPIRLHS